MIVLAVLNGPQLGLALGGAALVALAVLLLYGWEKMAWQPFAESLSKMA